MWNCNMGFMNGTGWFMGGGGFGMMFNLLILIAVAVVIYKIFQGFAIRPGGSRDRNDSLDILKRKFASGEINDEEYKRMREVLET